MYVANLIKLTLQNYIITNQNISHKENLLWYEEKKYKIFFSFVLMPINISTILSKKFWIRFLRYEMKWIVSSSINKYFNGLFYRALKNKGKYIWDIFFHFKQQHCTKNEWWSRWIVVVIVVFSVLSPPTLFTSARGS